MGKFKRFLGFAVMLTLIMTVFNGFSVHAAEKSNGLPEGWKRIEMNNLSEEVQEQIQQTVSQPDGVITPFAPAPSLTSLKITDLAIDQYNEIHVETTEIGTSRAGTRFVRWNGNLCSENFNETIILWDSSNIAYGYIRYFHTGIYYNDSLNLGTVRVTAESTNAMSPWNTLSTSATFTFQ